jgi:hypothetical protein
MVYEKSMSARENVWYEREVKLINQKFNNEIEPIPIKIFKRKNPAHIGLYCGSHIELHNKLGTTRNTLLHELVHHYLRNKNKGLQYRRPHRREFWDLFKYLYRGGTVKDFYDREKKSVEKVVLLKIAKSSPDFKISRVESLLKVWYSKRKRADNAIKKLEKSIKRLKKFSVNS